MHRPCCATARSLVPLFVLSLFCALAFVTCEGKGTGSERPQASLFPKERWLQYADPRDAGFSARKLEEARQYWDSTQSAACMVVHRGAVVAAWGEVDRRFMCHSVRKSLLSALYGVYVDAGTIDLKSTLAELGIDDRTPLTESEKKARIVDLLTSSSGIYLPAASEPANARKPPRGSNKPGERMFYNNWDFNALGTIFETATKTKLFDEFERAIAGPLAMEDFRARDMFYSYQLEQSTHPSYLFRMSARDLARFGLLYLNKGNWDGSRVLSEDWVKESTSKRIDANRAMGYGYLWWVYKEKPYAEWGMYCALGDGEQSLDIVPAHNLVIVTRTNTFDHKSVSREERFKLVRMIVEAKSETPSENPELVRMPERGPAMDTIAITAAEKAFLCSEPSVKTENSIYQDGNDVILKTPYGTFAILKTASGKWIMEDKRQEIVVEKNADNTVRRIVTEWSVNEEGRRALDDGKVDEAIAAFRRATEYYPNSTVGLGNLGEAYLKRGMKDEALEAYERASEIDPENREIIVELRKLHFTMPDCLAGEWAGDYLRAVTSSDSTAYIEYLKEYVSAESLQKTPIAQRIADHNDFMAEFGGFEPLLAVKTSNKEVYVFVQDWNSRAGWVFRFRMEEAHKQSKKEIALNGPLPPYLNERQVREIAGQDW